MSIRLVAGIIVFCLCFSAVMLGNMFSTMMIGEINRKRQDGDLIFYIGYTPPKVARIFTEYRRLYLDGKLHIYALAAFGVQMLCLVFLAVILLSIG